MKQILRLFSTLFDLNKRRGTVRYMFPAVVSFAAILGAAVITSTNESYIRLETTATMVEEGSRVSINVYAYAHEPVNAIDITLKFDESAVEVVEVDRGQSVLTIWTQDPIPKNGEVILRGGTFRKGFLGEHKIATIDLKAKEAGQSTFLATDVMLLAGDGEGTPVSMGEIQNGSISLYVYDENTTPDSIGVDVEVKIVTDINGDGKVSLKDVSSFMAAWNNKNKIYDFNGDGKMTFRDFSIILADMFLK